MTPGWRTSLACAVAVGAVVDDAENAHGIARDRNQPISAGTALLCFVTPRMPWARGARRISRARACVDRGLRFARHCRRTGARSMVSRRRCWAIDFLHSRGRILHGAMVYFHDPALFTRPGFFADTQSLDCRALLSRIAAGIARPLHSPCLPGMHSTFARYEAELGEKVAGLIRRTKKRTRRRTPLQRDDLLPGFYITTRATKFIHFVTASSAHPEIHPAHGGAKTRGPRHAQDRGRRMGGHLCPGQPDAIRGTPSGIVLLNSGRFRAFTLEQQRGAPRRGSRSRPRSNATPLAEFCLPAPIAVAYIPTRHLRAGCSISASA